MVRVHMLQKIAEFFRTRWGRISTGSGALVFLAVFLWPSENWSFDPEKAFAFAGALGAWLWSELESLGEPHPHDVKLFQRLREQISPEERRKMAEQNMGDPFPRTAFDGADEVHDTWKGAAYEFHDPVLNKAWSELREVLSDFVMKINSYTGPMPGNQSLATVKTTQDIQRGERSPLTVQKAKELNEAASKAAKELDAFEKLARSRLRV